MPVCLIAQPIHPAGSERLREAGFDVRLSAAADDAARALEVADADAAIVREGLSAALIDVAPRLAVISNHGTGTDKIAVAHAHALGIPVLYTPDANIRAVAEQAIMLMLAVARRVPQAHAAASQSDWQFRYTAPLHSLHGKTLGVVGFGRTGRIVAEMARAGLGMRVVVWSPSVDAAQVEALGARHVDTLDELLAVADVVTLHRPLRDDTRHTLNADALRRVKPNAIVINTSRGGLIDEAALATALRERRLYGAGLDVFAREPLLAGSPLATLDNVVLSPHVAGSTQEALVATALQCAEQIIDVFAGRQPRDMIDPRVWARRRAPTPRSSSTEQAA